MAATRRAPANVHLNSPPVPPPPSVDVFDVHSRVCISSYLFFFFFLRTFARLHAVYGAHSKRTQSQSLTRPCRASLDGVAHSRRRVALADDDEGDGAPLPVTRS